MKTNNPPSRWSSTPIRRRRPDATRRRILDAATDEFAAKGLAGARVNEIARRARINKRMLYHYFGGKEALWLAVLEAAYLNIRSSEQKLDVSRFAPKLAMQRLIEFNLEYVQSHPEFISLLLTENVHRARYLRHSRKVRALHNSLLDVIGDLLARGRTAGVFRKGVDAAELYITIAALSFFYFSNIHTLSTIFGRDFDTAEARRKHRKHVVNVVLGFLRPER
jgi:TetR/AcrR family transcriptional regulator